MARSRARLVIILFTIILALLFVQLFATPYVITVYSRGCWSVNTDGLFNHFNVRGCGTRSWLMMDVYAHVRTQLIINGANDVSVVLAQEPGLGGSCVGGETCPDLLSFSPPSPLSCTGCIVTQLGPNPLADWIIQGSGGTLASFPFITWILLVYLALAIRNTPRIYSNYQEAQRRELGWRGLTTLRKGLTIFSLGFFTFASYQFAAAWISMLVGPLPTFEFIGEGFIYIPVTIWLARFLTWKFPIQQSAPSTIPL